jgi:cold shock CspA family protein
MSSLAEGQKVQYEVETDRRSGKPAATNLRSA